MNEQVTVRESHDIQAKLATIGARFDFKVWIPRNDRVAVASMLGEEDGRSLLTSSPINFDEATFRTIENIDVLWVKGRYIARAFEVEHTTSIYSGLLRMADLLALQPQIRIRLHIVAPEDRRDKVLSEIRRPVFNYLEAGPLHERCSYIPYGAVQKLSLRNDLRYVKDSILEEYEEDA